MIYRSFDRICSAVAVRKRVDLVRTELKLNWRRRERGLEPRDHSFVWGAFGRQYQTSPAQPCAALGSAPSSD